MLTDDVLEQILCTISHLQIGVLGDLFLDRYLDIDASLTEPSLETGLDTYQVTRVRSLPGAAGTIINNLAALGVKRIFPMAVIGDDGEGYELRQALANLRVVDLDSVFSWPDRRTPTYTKPMLCQAGHLPRELNRLDIKNRLLLPAEAEEKVLLALTSLWPTLNALLVLDQVSEAECGVVTTGLRERLAQLGREDPQRIILADSRERIGLFSSVWTKPNFQECSRAVGGSEDVSTAPTCATDLAGRTGRPVFCTLGEKGILVADPRVQTLSVNLVPSFPVAGPIDIVGAGDSTSAAIACALAAGTQPSKAAAFGNLVASITIQQIGTTGTASPEQVRRRWQEVRS